MTEDEHEQNAYEDGLAKLVPELKFFVMVVAQIGISDSEGAPHNRTVIQARARGLLRAIQQIGADPDDYVQVFSIPPLPSRRAVDEPKKTI